MEENKFTDFLSKHWSKLLLGVMAIVCIAVWGERFLNSNRTHSKKDFLIANQILERFRSGEPLAVESIEAAENILKRHPELHPKYDAMLATTFFANQNSTKALPYAHSIIKRVDSDLPPFYRSYSETSLLIADQKYPLAFEEAKTLNTQLENQEGYENLYAMNLLRLVFLADTIGDDTIKKQAWEKLQHLPNYSKIESLFQEGKLTLQDYLQL